MPLITAQVCFFFTADVFADLEIGGEGDDLVMLILIWGSRWSNKMMLDMYII